MDQSLQSSSTEFWKVCNFIPVTSFLTSNSSQWSYIFIIYVYVYIQTNIYIVYIIYWCWCDCCGYCCNFCSTVVIITSLFRSFSQLLGIIMFSMLPLLFLYHCHFYCFIVPAVFFVVVLVAVINVIIITYPFLLLQLLWHGRYCDHFYGCQSGCCYYYHYWYF